MLLFKWINKSNPDVLFSTLIKTEIFGAETKHPLSASLVMARLGEGMVGQGSCR